MEREYFYRVDSAGRLLHEGSELTDAPFLDFFFSRLEPNNTGRRGEYAFVSRCGGEINFVDARFPVVFRALEAGNLRYAASLSVRFDPDLLRFEGVLLHPVREGVYGRFDAALGMEMSRKMVPFGPWYAYDDGVLHVIEPLQADPDLVLFRPESGVSCFGCGKDAAQGIQLPFLYSRSKQEASTFFVPPSWMTGHPGILHGGFISLFLDEVMAKVLKGLGLRGMTANLNVDFRRPARAEQMISLTAGVLRIEGRKAFLKARLEDHDGICAEGSSLYITAPVRDPADRREP